MEHVKYYLKAMEALPVNPQVAARILALAETDRNMSFAFLESIIKLDPSLSTRVLKVANSALYGRSREISNLQTAIAMMGFQTLKSLVVLITASSLYNQKKVPSQILEDLWNDAIRTAFFSKTIALLSGNKEIAEEVFLAGLLQDIGKLSFALTSPSDYEKLRNGIAITSSLPDDEEALLEKDLFGVDHRELGAMVLGLWDFPVQYAETCSLHGESNSASRYKKMILLTRMGSYLAKIPPDLDGESPQSGQLTRALATSCAVIGLSDSATELLRYKQTIETHLAKDQFFQNSWLV